LQQSKLKKENTPAGFNPLLNFDKQRRRLLTQLFYILEFF